MDVAVTGSHGLIGSALIGSLEADGHRVVRVVRGNSAKAGGGDHGDTIAWDPEAGTIDAAGLEGLDVVVHLAGEGIGEKRWTPEQKRRIHDSRTKGTGLLTRTLAGLTKPPASMISASAVGYYGNTGDTPLDETSPPGDDFVAGVAVDWEGSAAPAVSAGIRVVFIRTGIVLSPNGGVLARELPFFKLGIGGRSGSGRQYQRWITLADEVAAIRFLIDGDLSGPVNLTAPEPVTNGEFAKALGRTLHRPTTIIPMFGPRILFGRELADSLLLGGQRVLPKVLESAGFEFTHPKLDAALQDLLG